MVPLRSAGVCPRMDMGRDCGSLGQASAMRTQLEHVESEVHARILSLGHLSYPAGAQGQATAASGHHILSLPAQNVHSDKMPPRQATNWDKLVPGTNLSPTRRCQVQTCRKLVERWRRPSRYGFDIQMILSDIGNPAPAGRMDDEMAASPILPEANRRQWLRYALGRRDPPSLAPLSDGWTPVWAICSDMKVWEA